MKIAQDWDLAERLPGGKDGNPEGLVLLADSSPLISIDTKVPGNNLVRLEPLFA